MSLNNPTPIKAQALANTQAPTLVYTVPARTVLATVCVRATNASSNVARYSLWLLPAGEAAVSNKHLLNFNSEIAPSGTQVDMGIALSAGDKLFVRCSQENVAILVNGIAHSEDD